MLNLLALGCAPAPSPHVPRQVYQAHVFQESFDGTYACAPSAVLTALRVLKPAIWQSADPADFDGHVRRHVQTGTDSGLPAAAAFEAFTYAGVVGHPLPPDLEAFREELEHGTPVFVGLSGLGTRHAVSLLSFDEASDQWLVSDPAYPVPRYWSTETLQARLAEDEGVHHAVELVSRSQAIANCRENPKWCRHAPVGFLNPEWVLDGGGP